MHRLDASCSYLLLTYPPLDRLDAFLMPRSESDSHMRLLERLFVMRPQLSNAIGRLSAKRRPQATLRGIARLDPRVEHCKGFWMPLRRRNAAHVEAHVFHSGTLPCNRKLLPIRSQPLREKRPADENRGCLQPASTSRTVINGASSRRARFWKAAPYSRSSSRWQASRSC